MIENTEENRYKLATEKVESMDIETMQAILVDLLLGDYKKDDGFFMEEWEHFYAEGGNP